MKRKFVIGIDGSGIDEMLRGIEEYKIWLEQKCNELVQRLVDRGVNVANAGFASAVYDGTNDFRVTFEERGDLIKAVIATGATVLFVEFGTGITYPDNHPEAAANGMVRGSYGKGYGNQLTWGYYGDALGTNGFYAKNKDGSIKDPHVVLTHGNPANMPMYNAARLLEQEFESIAREVFAQ